MKTIDMQVCYEPIDVPCDVETCPICDAAIVIDEVREWEYESGKPVSISVDCTTEPDVDSKEWPSWFREHWSMPYVDWLPVEMRVLEWFQRQYKCV